MAPANTLDLTGIANFEAKTEPVLEISHAEMHQDRLLWSSVCSVDLGRIRAQTTAQKHETTQHPQRELPTHTSAQ
jgi:hypothetical protein